MQRPQRNELYNFLSNSLAAYVKAAPMLPCKLQSPPNEAWKCGLTWRYTIQWEMLQCHRPCREIILQMSHVDTCMCTCISVEAPC